MQTLPPFLLGFIQSTQLGCLVLDDAGLIRFANGRLLSILDYDAADVVGQPAERLLPQRLHRVHGAAFARAVAGSGPHLADRRIFLPGLRRDGSEVPFELFQSRWVCDGHVYFGVILRDASDDFDRSRRLMHHAATCAVTGLGTRRTFIERLARTLQHKGNRVLVAVVAIHGFRDINETLGFSVGDTVLQSVAGRLIATLPPQATVGRLEGGDFGAFLVMENGCSPGDYGQTILDAFSLAIEVDTHSLPVRVDLGLASTELHGHEPEVLIAAADQAALHARATSDRRWHLFTPAMATATRERRQQKDEVLRAIKGGELCLHYQPQVCLRTGAVIGAEALIRWRHPVRGTLPPGAFLRHIVASALEEPVGWWILDEACKQLADWRLAGLPNIRIGVNLFPAQFLSGALVGRVETAVRDAAIDPSALELEITETTALDDVGLARSQIECLRAIGVRVAFDDFGTGYASLATLTRMPFTTLKIDRGFVRDIGTQGHGAVVTRSMLAIAREMEVEAIAEGVETEEQRSFLADHGCDVGQGYLFGKAVAPQDLSAAWRGMSGVFAACARSAPPPIATLRREAAPGLARPDQSHAPERLGARDPHFRQRRV